MQTTTDTLLKLRDEIERRQKEALAEEDHYKATDQPIAKARAAGMWLALDKLLATLDRTIDEAAEREETVARGSSPAPGSAALVDCKERLQIRSGLPGGGVVMVRMQTSASTGTTQLLDMGEAAWLAVALAEAIREAMPPNGVINKPSSDK